LFSDVKLATIIVPALNGGENLVRLVQTALVQTYAPLEVFVVDGGSTDGSIEVLKRLRSGREGLRILEEVSFGSARGTANARNLGVVNSNGNYLLFFDADFELTDRELVNKAQRALEEHPWVGVRVFPKIDSWLEFHTSIDDYRKDLRCNVHTYCGFTREVFEDLMFDPDLGLGEDEDLRRRAKQHLNLEPSYIDAYCERHFIHTFRQWESQAFWHGRTHMRFLSKWKGPGIEVLALRAGAFLSLTISVASALFSPLLSLAFFAIFLARIAVAYAYSATRGRYRIFYLILRESLWGGVFFTGFVTGLVRAARSHFELKRFRSIH
jgi:glycosyltransferase involved in cell wall biosynthesis